MIWHRPRVGATYVATLTEGATIRLDDGREFSTPSGAAMAAANLTAYDGWHAWRLDNAEQPRLHDLRTALSRRAREAPEADQ
jgi:hypothetical protein